jgi:hypothetical protein
MEWLEQRRSAAKPLKAGGDADWLDALARRRKFFFQHTHLLQQL